MPDDRDESATSAGDPLWYKDAVIYQLHVRAFCDSDGDGVGDFRGLAEKLDYIRDLGATAIWLLPFYPSPLGDDGYDIADYTGVHPAYGTLADFKLFLREAHDRGLRVITELVVNHTPDRHPWFQRALAAAYFGSEAGDECHMAFHFPLMPRMFMALRMEDRYPIIDILGQTPAIPESAQWAIFLRNHDELTLEMVTDEERDYMYRVYADDARARINLGIRRRLAPLLGNDRRRIELMKMLLMSLPGTPVLYDGDELGMGDNIYLGDRNGVRTPMQWNLDRNAGFSRANPRQLFLPVVIDPDFSYETVNVETQLNNPNSLLWWTRRLIAQRNRTRAFGRGTLEFLPASNAKVLAFVRRHLGEQVLVVANLSRHVQHVELDLQSFRDLVPVEVFGLTEFPRIGSHPYLLTLSPHGWYWFSLETRSPAAPEVGAPVGEVPAISAPAAWEALFRGRSKATLEEILPRFLATRRWFGGKARHVKGAEIVDAVPLPVGRSVTYLALARVDYTEGDPDTYVLALGFSAGERAAKMLESEPHRVVARARLRGVEGVIHGALGDPAFGQALLDAVARRRVFRGTSGAVVGVPARAFKRLRGEAPLEPAPLGAEQSNTSLVFGDRLILKVFRRVEPGSHPDLEIGRFLSERAGFANVPAVAGAIEYRPRKGEAVALAILQQNVPSEGDAWQLTLDALGRYFERVLALPRSRRTPPPVPEVPLVQLARVDMPPEAQEPIGTYLADARLLGRRTAELHLRLAGESGDPAFAPEPFTPFYQRSLYQSMRNLTERSFALLRRRLGDLPEPTRTAAAALVEQQGEVMRRFRVIADRKVTALRTRLHNDYHLGQVLRCGADFVIIDFEGEPAVPLSTRRIKRCPLRDAAGMIRSFHYAAYYGLQGVGVHPEAAAQLRAWAHLWYAWVSAAFLASYLETAGPAAFLPQDEREFNDLLTIYLLEKAVYELGYELNNRPEWVHLPMAGIATLLAAGR
jgi:maltose alpha-D-glucosyltransferase/alpha-amylase